MTMRAILAFIDDSTEPALLRAQFESLGWRVAWRPVGKPSDLLAAFDEPADLGVVCGHGDAGGLIFPPLGNGVDVVCLPNDRMPPRLLAGFTHNLPPALISTACATGTPAFAAAFALEGSGLYIAPAGYPDGSAVPVLLNLAAYLVSVRKFSWSEAIAAANAYTTPDNWFKVFSN